MLIILIYAISHKIILDDKPTEVNELIYVIKQDLAKINHQVQQFVETILRLVDWAIIRIFNKAA